MVKLQRRLIEGHDAVVEGRDITTVVFPKAEYKFYLDADLKVRADRRFKEMVSRGVDISLSQVTEQMKERDCADLSRKVSPLKKARDAIYIDTQGLNIEQVLDKIISYIGK